jgi:hypothetical protein
MNLENKYRFDDGAFLSSPSSSRHQEKKSRSMMFIVPVSFLVLLALGFVSSKMIFNKGAIEDTTMPREGSRSDQHNAFDEPSAYALFDTTDLPPITADTEPTFDVDEILRWEQGHPTQDIHAERMSQIDIEEQDVLKMLSETGDEDEEDHDPVLSYNLRNLMGSHHGQMHMPLACNANLASQPCTSISSFSITPNETVVIPCGECFEVNIEDGSTWELPDGLRVEGKLFIPNTSSFTLRTTFVFVLGLLKIDPPSDGNQVTISLYGEAEVTYTADMPGMKCDDTGCNMGSKVIAVLGKLGTDYLPA